MVIALSGDIDYDNTIAIIAEEFSDLKQQELNKTEFVADKLDSAITVDIVGNESDEVFNSI